MIVCGSKDKTLGVSSVRNLRELPNAEVCMMEDAGHACYMNKPDEWHKLLYNFITQLEAF